MSNGDDDERINAAPVVGDEPMDETARDHLRRSGEAAKEVARSGWAAIRGGGRAVGDRSKEVVDSSRDSLDRGYRTVTLKAYRDEVDDALEEIVDVLAAQDAEIRHLRARVEQLEAGSRPGADG